MDFVLSTTQLLSVLLIKFFSVNF